MQTHAMNEGQFRAFNVEGLAILKALVQETERANEACDAWHASGHIADYRTYQTRLRNVEEADAQYQRIRQKILHSGGR
jgi:hypothetical protein